MVKQVPRYVSPKEAAENRARVRAWLYWTAVALPVLLALFAFGYSDQAPVALRNAVIAIDRAFGYPMLWLISMLAGK
jgi:hypothetical protein